jgi:hypothetical protein
MAGAVDIGRLVHQGHLHDERLIRDEQKMREDVGLPFRGPFLWRRAQLRVRSLGEAQIGIDPM